MDEVGDHYRRARVRLTELLGDLDDASWRRDVPACPGWRVHDVVAHLVGVIEDGMAGRLDGPPSEVLSAEEVARHRDDPSCDLLARWGELAPVFESVITTHEVWPATFDVLSHEHDVRGALDRPGARDVDTVHVAARRLIEGLELPVVLRVHLDGETVESAPADGPMLELRTTAFEVVRLRLGRRSRQQVMALDWSTAPSAEVVEALFVFGPRPDALVE
ncbi:maleylpyruvate isomerase family mycothiol-dependent enzyme [soil metagenome]